LGHHWMIGYGHHAEAIRAWAKLAGASLRIVQAETPLDSWRSSRQSFVT
jgi:L-arabinose isomerase